MKISFIIPAYNEENYLEQCLRSVVAQAQQPGSNVEIIVVNNASTDHTAEIARRFPEVRLINEPRRGLARARQAGFAAATGELIANIDADTMLPPGWIQTVRSYFAENQKLVALSGPHLFYDGTPSIRAWAKAFYAVAYGSYLWHRYVLRMSSLLQGGNFVVKKSALQEIGGFDAAYEFYGEDADIARRLFKVGDVTFTYQLPIFASARRLKAEGNFTTAFRYIFGYLWTVNFKKPPSNATAHPLSKEPAHIR
jgi:glycosyltransferase involved in cell wall biosynthesis